MSETLIRNGSRSFKKCVLEQDILIFLIFFFLQLLQIKDTMPSLHFLKEKPGHDSDFGQESKRSLLFNLKK